jgi:23S rRNA (cytidine1920-2'-O)/16S rRNA (cytidine1409-2'-O)-methyltransferase
VVALDVGKGLLDDRLRRDARVVVREGENARYLERTSFSEPLGAIAVDASFIGLDKLLPALAGLLDPGGWLLAMIKTQFEAGRELARRHRGVIADEALRQGIVDAVAEQIDAAGFRRLGRCDSRLKGPRGNLEHFVWAERVERATVEPRDDRATVERKEEPDAPG